MEAIVTPGEPRGKTKTRTRLSKTFKKLRDTISRSSKQGRPIEENGAETREFTPVGEAKEDIEPSNYAVANVATTMETKPPATWMSTWTEGVTHAVPAPTTRSASTGIIDHLYYEPEPKPHPDWDRLEELLAEDEAQAQSKTVTRHFSPYTVSNRERERFQRVALGMSETQVRRANRYTPGTYEVERLH